MSEAFKSSSSNEAPRVEAEESAESSEEIKEAVEQALKMQDRIDEILAMENPDNEIKQESIELEMAMQEIHKDPVKGGMFTYKLVEKRKQEGWVRPSDRPASVAA